ncbi:MAG: succinate dehydrogenase assembly factor 2 [Gammaproteobacteria bacterium]|nr:succinate dehydrogenase assembly factor 2 [Gammaproteobacteria bacterium]
MSELAKLRWHCRRGMREMDLLLGGWLDEHYSRASPELQQAFSTILEELDQDILDWVMQRRPCPPQYAELVGELRHIRKPQSN